MVINLNFKLIINFNFNLIIIQNIINKIDQLNLIINFFINKNLNNPFLMNK